MTDIDPDVVALDDEELARRVAEWDQPTDECRELARRCLLYRADKALLDALEKAVPECVVWHLDVNAHHGDDYLRAGLVQLSGYPSRVGRVRPLREALGELINKGGASGEGDR